MKHIRDRLAVQSSYYHFESITYRSDEKLKCSSLLQLVHADQKESLLESILFNSTRLRCCSSTLFPNTWMVAPASEPHITRQMAAIPPNHPNQVDVCSASNFEAFTTTHIVLDLECSFEDK